MILQRESGIRFFSVTILVTCITRYLQADHHHGFREQQEMDLGWTEANIMCARPQIAVQTSDV